jgi:hypothetical protein
MQRINLDWWCRVAFAVRDLSDIEPDTPFADFYKRAYPAILVLAANYADKALIGLSVSRVAGDALYNAYQAIAKDTSRTEPLQFTEAATFKKAVSDFQIVLSAELQTIDAYYVKPKGIFSTRRLIESAELVFPEDAIALLPEEAKNDLRESGRCLAFELATASGFHVARATETVIKQLMKAAGCARGQQNWGDYIRQLKAKNVNAAITHHIEQIKDLHRNPIIHPELTLTMPEALSLWAVCTSAIAAMLDEIRGLALPAGIPTASVTLSPPASLPSSTTTP